VDRRGRAEVGPGRGCHRLGGSAVRRGASARGRERRGGGGCWCTGASELRLLSRAAKIRLSLSSQSMKFIRHSLSLQSLLNLFCLTICQVGNTIPSQQSGQFAWLLV
jgi:hypothetical protein